MAKCIAVMAPILLPQTDSFYTSIYLYAYLSTVSASLDSL